MDSATSFEDLALDRPALLTIGTFDGVHRGHRFLLEQAQQRAVEHGYGLVVVTFDPCPAVVLRPELRRYQLTTAAQKLRLLEAVGPALALLLTFTPALSQLSADQFIDELESRLHVREMWLGEDFHFGRNRSGNLTMLVERGRASGFSLHVVSRRMDDTASISSTRVRQALAAGDVAGALPLLGYPFAVDASACHVTPMPLSNARPARVVVPAHLAVPGIGTYAVLANEQETVASIAGEPEGEILVWPYSSPCDIEFITRVSADPIASNNDFALLLPEVQGVLHDWQRPVYPASGKY